VPEGGRSEVVLRDPAITDPWLGSLPYV